jgi:hypothetical protein
MYLWTTEHMAEVEHARATFDRGALGHVDEGRSESAAAIG